MYGMYVTRCVCAVLATNSIKPTHSIKVNIIWMLLFQISPTFCETYSTSQRVEYFRAYIFMKNKRKKIKLQPSNSKFNRLSERLCVVKAYQFTSVLYKLSYFFILHNNKTFSTSNRQKLYLGLGFYLFLCYLLMAFVCGFGDGGVF